MIYTSPLDELLQALAIHYHLYADDMQLYLNFDIENGLEAVGYVEYAVSLIIDNAWQDRGCCNWILLITLNSSTP